MSEENEVYQVGSATWWQNTEKYKGTGIARNVFDNPGKIVWSSISGTAMAEYEMYKEGLNLLPGETHISPYGEVIVGK